MSRIKGFNPDLVCCQEVLVFHNKDANNTFFEKEFKAMGYSMLMVDHAYAPILLAWRDERFRLNHREEEFDATLFDGRFILVTLFDKYAEQTLLVASCHLKAGARQPEEDKRLDQIKEARRLIQCRMEATASGVIWAGDFNMESELDVVRSETKRPVAQNRDELTKAYGHLLQEGLAASGRKHEVQSAWREQH